MATAAISTTTAPATTSPSVKLQPRQQQQPGAAVWTAAVCVAAVATVAAGVARLLTPGSPSLFGIPDCAAQLSAGRWHAAGTPWDLTVPPLPAGSGSSDVWLPDTCLPARLTTADVRTCLGGAAARVVVVGDSGARDLFRALRARVDPSRYPLDGEQPAGDARHSDMRDTQPTAGAPAVEFVWDPFLNRTDALQPAKEGARGANGDPRVVSLVVLGAGLWHVRHLEAAGADGGGSPAAALANFSANVGAAADAVDQLRARQLVAAAAAGEVEHDGVDSAHEDARATAAVSAAAAAAARAVVRLPSPMVQSLLSPARSSMTNAAAGMYAAEMQRLVAARAPRAVAAAAGIAASHGGGRRNRHSKHNQRHWHHGLPEPLWLAGEAGHAVLAASPTRTPDGLHYAPEVLAAEADALLQQLCVPLLLERVGTVLVADGSGDAPGSGVVARFDRATCCLPYRRPNWKAIAFLAAAGIAGPGIYAVRRFLPTNRIPRLLYASLPNRATAAAAAAMFVVLAACFVADRTALYAKRGKLFDGAEFWALNALWVVPGLATVRMDERGRGFLNRCQTDEWKGWMQLAILVYHYTGASSVLPVYSVIRVLVSAYLFMTGYGHFTFFATKGDFGLRRAGAVLLRLNLLPAALAYAMSSDAAFYYFGPLVSFWFLAIYATMAVARGVNARLDSPALPLKIALSAVVCRLLIGGGGSGGDLLAFVVGPVFRRAFGITWDVREALFRLALDPWAVHAGMFVAYLVLRHERGLGVLPCWPSSSLHRASAAAVGGSATLPLVAVAKGSDGDDGGRRGKTGTGTSGEEDKALDGFGSDGGSSEASSNLDTRSGAAGRWWRPWHRLQLPPLLHRLPGWTHAALPLLALALTLWASATLFPASTGKRARNAWHPILSVAAVVLFVAARNATPALRAAHSPLLAAAGRVSLETFVLQFHVWLAADTRATWRPLAAAVTAAGAGAAPAVVLDWLDPAVATVLFLALAVAAERASVVLVTATLGPRLPAAPPPPPSPATTTTTGDGDLEGGGGAAPPSSTRWRWLEPDDAAVLQRVAVLCGGMIVWNWL
ncbi:hypothetical protein HK405_002836 [Cladochytrium tenue]|nr:hypothetical protein HK405_002836 [Cladochytrium tenue]